MAEGRVNLSDDCVVLLEQVLKSNRDLAAENQRLRQEHERSANSQAEVLQRIEQRLQDRERTVPVGRPRRRDERKIAVPPACRRSVRKIYKVLEKKEDFNGFYLDEEANSANNSTIFERVVTQVLHEYGGQERCPWTRPVMEAALQRYFVSCLETRRLKTSSKYEEHKRKTRKSGRQREKLTRRTTALELAEWEDAHQKGRAAEILIMDAMSSEESCYEDDDRSKKVVNYKVKSLPWATKSLKKTKKKLDKAYKKSLTKRAQDRILPRVAAAEPSQRQPPGKGFPEWAVEQPS